MYLKKNTPLIFKFLFYRGRPEDGYKMHTSLVSERETVFRTAYSALHKLDWKLPLLSQLMFDLLLLNGYIVCHIMPYMWALSHNIQYRATMGSHPEAQLIANVKRRDINQCRAHRIRFYIRFSIFVS